MNEVNYYGSADFNETVCPKCKSGDNLNKDATFGTLLGWSRGEDPNHYHTNIKCLECQFSFVRHFIKSGQRIWYTNGNSYVILGDAMNTCCDQNYFHPCECGGWIKHAQKGKSTSFSAKPGGGYRPNQPMFWECQNCHTITKDKRYD